MTRRVSVRWPDPAPFDRHPAPIRILAVSDELDPALAHESNRAALAPVDLVVGCGDLDAEELCFLADAFRVPLLYVLGNHDRGARWALEAARLPTPIHAVADELGLAIAGLSWPGHESRAAHARRDEVAAWSDVVRVALRLLARRVRRRRSQPVLVVSHGAPRGMGDGPDAYHAGFDAYRWLVERLRPPLWLHGHTPPASAPAREVRAGATVVCNVTGSVLVELLPPVPSDAAGA